MEIYYFDDVDALGIAFRPEEVRRGEKARARYVEPLPNVRLWYTEDGRVYALEIESRASERIELDEVRITGLNVDVEPE